MTSKRQTIAAIAICTSLTLRAAGNNPSARLDVNFGKVPLSFEPNRGQSDARVDYVSRGQGYTLFLTGDQAVLRLIRTKDHSSLLRMKLAGANAQAAASGMDQLPGHANYFRGKDPSKWQTDIPTYAKVKYTGVYPGVDLVYYGNRGRLEHDFILAPGADPAQIVLSIEGAQLKAGPQGELCLIIDGGELRFEKPTVYQVQAGRKHIVDGSYSLDGNKVRFKLGAYDRGRELVIDPLLVYTSYLGGSLSDNGTGIAVDSAGSVYVTGYTASLDFPTLNSIFPTSNQGSSTESFEAFVTKFNAAGTALAYSTYLGGPYDSTTGDEIQPNDIAVDSQMNAYVGGSTNQNDFPVTTGAFQTICGPTAGTAETPVANCGFAGNSFLTKINAAGNALVYSTFLGGNVGPNAITGVAVDSAGEAYVTGYTESLCSEPCYPYELFPTTGGAFQSGSQISAGVGNPYAFFTKFDSAGATLLYSTLFGSASPTGNAQNITKAFGIAIDSTGDAYITGWTQDGNLPTTAGAFQTTAGPILGNSDPGNYYFLLGYRAFVAKFDPTQANAASLVYATYLGGNVSGASDTAAGIAVDSKGNAYITGQAGCPDFPTTKKAFQTTCYANGTACTAGFITKLNAAGSALVYSTMLGDQSDGSGSAVTPVRIRVNSSGNAFVTGVTGGGFPLSNPIQTYDGGAPGFVAEMTPAGNALQFSTYFGGAAPAVYPASLAIDSVGSVYVTGSTSALTPTPGAYQQTYGGGSYDAFVAKIATVAADLQVTNSAAKGVATGADLTYTITALNNGPDTAPGVKVTDTLPSGTTLVSVSTSAGTCKSPVVGGTGTVVCTIGTMAAGDMATVTLTVNVSAPVGTIVTDIAHVQATAYDPNAANNISAAHTKVVK